MKKIKMILFMRYFYSVIVLIGILFSCTNVQAQISVIRGPYLQSATSSSIILKWRTNAATDSKVWYGTTAGSLDLSEIDGAVTTEHQVQLTGLTPNTVYYYAVGSSSNMLTGNTTNHYFKTAPTIGTEQPIHMWVLGDCGMGNSDARAVRDAYYNHIGTDHTDMILMLGDNAYTDGTDAQYQTAVFQNMYEDKLRNTTLWSCPGNHEFYNGYTFSSTQTGAYYDIFTFPTNGEAGGLASGTEAYYSFDYGNMHFITMDSHDTDRNPGSPMLTWLENDLAATTQKWIIVLFHHPPYTKGSHDSDWYADSQGRMYEMRENVLPILENYGVDLVLSGHSHAYERSYLMEGHYGVSSTFDPGTMIIDPGNGKEDGDGVFEKDVTGGNTSPGADGVIYVVAGASGKVKNTFGLNHPAMMVSMAEMGSVLLDVDGDRLDFQYLNRYGVIRDYFTISKAAPTCTDGIQNGDETGVDCGGASCPACCPEIGMACDDGDPNTYNDAEDGHCNCVGLSCNGTELTLIEQGSTWKYLDDGSDQGTAWQSPSFDDSTWSSSAAQFGYGDGDETTVVDYGTDANNKHITTYFRRSFQVDNVGLHTTLYLELLRDDGAVVYLNGAEVLRDNMPTGNINYLTVTPTFTPTANENDFFNFILSSSDLVQGTNVIAIEIHQSSVTSSDLSFDLELRADYNECSSCIDGLQNGDETGVDCGGTNCAACPTCSDGIQNGDEQGIDCGGNTCNPCPTCTDGVRNGDEIGVDCGGANCPACPSCTDGIQNGDEQGVDCGGLICPACPTCFDGVQNGDEIGIDCGGTNCSACPTCTDGIQNGDEQGVDCGGTACVPCPSCGDGIQNGEETGIDCGGTICPACPSCTDGIQNGDEQGVDCGGANCAPCPTCTDGIQNGNETGVDCGSATCPACPTCTDGIQNGDEIGVDCGGANCAPCPTCTDGVQNGNETGVDCGGADCAACPTCTDGIQNGDETDVDCGGANCVPCPTCTDGVQNGDETDVDCGGMDCPACPTCNDGIQNGDETDVDCGGMDCPPCATCFDGVQNGDETDIDCGGTACDPCPTCNDGIQNGDETDVDCGGSLCTACPTCSDGIQNGEETDIDCGGTICPACPTCSDGMQNGDETGVDCGGVNCVPCATCTDGVQNGDETGVDCGGTDCSACPTCTDGIQNGDETDVDCGGANCAPCPTCMDGVQNGDETGVDCGGSACSACPTCTDGIQNGDETDVDCGGANCAPCPTCTDGVQNGDETSVDCGGSACSACPTCTDGIQNGDETDVDCGGSACAPCATCTDGIQNGDETGVDCGGANCAPCISCSDGLQNGDEQGVDCGGTNCPACPSCFDGLQNGDETGVDCGGANCDPCPTCSDGLQNGDETDIDCGGANCDPCPTCSDGIQNGDEMGVDCGGFYCPICPSCNDGVQNGDETGVDCGGVDCGPCSTCSDGVQNGDETGVDCGGSSCPICPSCNDGVQNGDEIGIDCGGTDCAPCPTCSDGIQNGIETGVDCGGNCVACPGCSDGVQNGDETGIDCGGSMCAPCNSTNNYCDLGGISTQYEWIESVVLESISNPSGDDGGYGNYTSMIATLTPLNTYTVSLTPGFGSGVYKEGWRIWIDWNQDNDFSDSGELVFSSNPTQSGVMGIINVPANAISGNTRMRIAMQWNAIPINSCGTISYGEVEDYSISITGGAVPSCNDGLQNGDEIGVDCGGASCPSCPTCFDGVQNGTETDIDCGGNCTACPTCTDGVQNGDEIGIDCGGADCMPCGTCSDGIQNGTETGVDCGGNCAACPILDSYCDFKGNNTYYEFINAVAMGTINNNSGSDGGYGNYTNMSTNVTRGESVVISLSPGFSGATYKEGWRVWIDWNQDGDFNDNGELLFSKSPTRYTVNETFVVPMTATLGITRMRVAMRWNAIPSPSSCGSYSYGEVEDYTINVLDAFSSSNCENCGVCGANAGANGYEWIDNVKIGDIDNTSGDDQGYGNYLQLSTKVGVGKTYPIELTPGFKGNKEYKEAWGIWIDFNHDGDFQDGGEQVFQHNPTRSAVEGIILVPHSALTGTTVMRVVMQWNASPSACGTFQYGEVEDYSIEIVQGSSKTQADSPIEDTKPLQIALHPNPTKGKLFIQYNAENSSNLQLKVFNSLGQMVLQQAVEHTVNAKQTLELEVGDLANGTYLVELSNGKERSISKFVLLK